ncbi:MAG: amidoligase family protein [Planctomycetes bacterium]|nr:amidoligase family protein [Planctomycetota bacterium]
MTSTDDRPPRPALELPPFTTTASGAPRRVGVEIELSGPDVAEAARSVAAVVGGEVRTISPYEAEVRGGDAGTWRVELDYVVLKRLGREHAEAAEEPGPLAELAEAVLRAGSEALVPVEVISPPLPLPELGRAEDVLRALRREGALGTRAELAYAFGLQLNPEMPALDAPTVLAYLQAFLCLQEWLVRASCIDWTRRLTGYSAAFPKDYVRRVVDPAYRPDLATLIDDYLAANPTRNRALDLLPLFTELDEPRVRAVVSDERVTSRPALHYRLPNCEIDDPTWGLHVPWGHWMEVERLAADDARRAELGAAYGDVLAQPFEALLGSWADEVERRLARGAR